MQSKPQIVSLAVGITVGIDACRLRSGGGVVHLVGILKDGDPTARGIREVHLWGHRSLLDSVADAPWLVKHRPPELDGSLLRQLWWQFHSLAKEAQRNGCDVLFTADASTVCRFRPSVVLSQDMLSYEPGVMRHFGVSRARLRLITIGVLQTRAMQRADGVIFLTRYAADVIQQSTGKLARLAVIPHGIGDKFRQTTSGGDWPDAAGREIHALYVSNASMYKHQWEVVRAIGELRRRGHNVHLLLVGGGAGRAQKLMEGAIAETDPRGEFVECREFVPHDEIPDLLSQADLFIFASSCENMPVTLLEAMAGGLPIACSNRGPMPEVLKDGGVYFDPEDHLSIAEAVHRIIIDPVLRGAIAQRARQLSEQYSWPRCADDTWSFISKVAMESR